MLRTGTLNLTSVVAVVAEELISVRRISYEISGRCRWFVFLRVPWVLVLVRPFLSMSWCRTLARLVVSGAGSTRAVTWVSGLNCR